MRNRIIEIVNKEIKNGQYYVMSEYNEYDNSVKVQTLSRTYHYFDLALSDEQMIEWIRVNEYKQDVYKDLERTECVYTYIEEKREGYIRYVSAKGERWEVIGVCTNIGTCREGAASPMPELNCPITPSYNNECCPMTINVLNNAN